MIRTNLFLQLCLTATVACGDAQDHTPLTFTQDGDSFVLTGEIDGDTQDAFDDALDAAPEVRTLILQSIGGSVDDEANVAFARVVRQMGFTTIVPSDGLVASGGTDLFLAGQTRVLEQGACVGVHSWAAEDFTATDLPRTDPEHDRYLSYYADLGIDPDFYWFTIEAAPADGMHWITADEAARFAVSTEAIPSLGTAQMCDQR